MNGARRSLVSPTSWFLRAVWVYLYATLVAVFELLRKTEGQGKPTTRNYSRRSQFQD